LLKINTRLRRGLESDPTLILIDHLTSEQVKAQAAIDVALGLPFTDAGELLVLIPFRDRWDLTQTCLRTLASQQFSADVSLRVVLIDNGSVNLETSAGLGEVAKNHPTLNIQTLQANYEFNYSRLNNDGYRQFKAAETKWVLFLNNDVELLDQAILQRMVSALAAVNDVAAIGCTLLYPNRQIQHLFAAPGVKIIAAHPMKGVDFNPLLEWFAKAIRPVAAVTGAVMMVRANDFEAVGFMDENLPTMAQDIDLCLKFYYDLGKFSATVTYCSVIHCESKTKKADFSRIEIQRMSNKWGSKLLAHPFYSKAFSRFSESPLLVLGVEPKYPVDQVF
jgi:GT2 family glycosyltransferase